MPNTITPAILKERFAARYAEPCNLTTGVIARLWKLTGTRRRGRNVTRDTLEERAERTIKLMHEAAHDV